MTDIPPSEPWSQQGPSVPEDPFAPNPKRRRTGLIVGMVVAGVLLAMVVCCGGISAFVYVSLGVLESDVQSDVEHLPAIQQHIGDISALKLNLLRSAEMSDDESFAFDIEGDKGKGLLEVVVNGDHAGIGVAKAHLRLPNGELIDVLDPKISEPDTPQLDTPDPDVIEP